MRKENICYGCHDVIRDEVVTLPGGQIYHPEHLVCFSCVEKIDESDSIFYVDTELYCRYHYSLLKAGFCKGCEQALLGEYLENKEDLWHPNCFIIFKVF